MSDPNPAIASSDDALYLSMGGSYDLDDGEDPTSGQSSTRRGVTNDMYRSVRPKRIAPGTRKVGSDGPVPHVTLTPGAGQIS